MKKILSLVLALAMVLSLVVCSGITASAKKAYISVEKDGVEYIYSSACEWADSNVPDGMTVSFDEANKVLSITIENFTCDKLNIGDTDISKIDFTVKGNNIIGDNVNDNNFTIESSYSDGFSRGMTFASNTVVHGDGTLNVADKIMAISSGEKQIAFDNDFSGTLNAYSYDEVGAAIYAPSFLVYKGNSSIFIKSANGIGLNVTSPSYTMCDNFIVAGKARALMASSFTFNNYDNFNVVASKEFLPNDVSSITEPFSFNSATLSSYKTIAVNYVYENKVPTSNSIKDISLDDKIVAAGNGTGFGAHFDNTEAELEKAFNVTDKTYGINVWIIVKDADGTVTAADKDLIAKALGADEKVVKYYDASAYMNAYSSADNNYKVSDVHELGAPVKVCIAVDDSFAEKADNFKLFEIHNGKVIEVPFTYDATKGAIIAEVSGFSTFALVEVGVEETPEPTPTPSETIADTADNTTVGIFAASLGFAILGTALVAKKRNDVD